MCTHEGFEVDRRTLLQAGALGGLAALLGGCAGGGGVAANDTAPGPIWREGLKPGESLRIASPTPGKAAGGLPSEPTTPVTGVIPRSAWTNSAVITSRCHPMNGINKITIHHAAVDNSDLRSAEDVKRRLLSIRQDHINRRPEPFADIGYHYIVDPQGRVWEGRPLKWQGAHVADRNDNNLGVMLLGDFTKQTPTNAQVNAMDAFVAQQMQRYRIPVSRVYTHRELGKSTCPGANLQRYVDSSRTSGRLRLA
jgi:hypothetical protein